MNLLIKVLIYETDSGKLPFNDWLNDLDKQTRAIVQTRVDRLTRGNFGDCKSLKDGLWELKIHYGAGYRVYFGKINNTIVLLLNGGDKGSQSKDIEKAKSYWLDCKEKLWEEL